MKFLMMGVFMALTASISGASENDVLRIALPVRQLQLDPQKIEDMYSMLVVNQLYARLFKYTPDGQIRPDLVESWSVSKDKTRYTFRVKKQSFSDGTPIKASHIANSIKRIFVTEAALASDLNLIKGAVKFSKSKNVDDLKISIDGDQILKIETEKPTGLLMYLLAVPDVGVIKLESPNQNYEFNLSNPFSGPYKIASMNDSQLKLEKWRSSDLESTHPAKFLLFNLFEKIDIAKVMSGQFTDTSSFMTFDEDKSPLEGNPSWHPVVSEASNERFIVMNPKKVPLKVRQWMLSKIDSDDFVKLIGDKTINPAYGFIPTCISGHLKKKVLTKTQDLKLDRPLQIKITYGANLPYSDKFKSYLKGAWKHPKLNIEFEALPISDYLQKLFNGTSQVIIGARGIDYPEGFSVVTYFRSGLKSNYFFVKNKKIDQLIDDASVEGSLEKRSRIYELIQEQVINEATVIPLAFGSWKKYYWSQNVKAVPAHPIGTHFISLEMITMADK